MTSEQAVDMSRTADTVSALIEEAAVRPRPSTQSPDLNPAEKIAPDDQYAPRIETLVDQWRPRYAAARADIDRFEHRFKTAEDRLMEYFEEQS